jgi:aspartyl-tRNA(Asn)/glutamyl-tRNA(Gln) amidotransferase subunit A
MSSGRPPRATASGTGRIGVLERFFIHALKDEVADAVLFAMRKLQDSGIAFEGRDGGGIEDAREVWMEVCTPEFAAAHPLLKDPGRRRLVSPQPRAWIEQGERLPEEERAEARRRREQIRGWFLSRLEGVDALLIPTTPYAAPRATDKKVELGRPGRVVETSEVGPGFITCPVNLAGLPALNLPAGRSSQGMPIGVSLVGRPDGEQALLQLAARWERESAYRPRYPDAPPP